jgi:putative FmdB family regulatory protein
MPIYDYRCPNGHTFEVFQRMSDPPVERCQECGAGPVEKVLYPVAVHFKGSGFYATDYGKGSRKKGSRDGDSGTDSGADKGAKAEKADKKDGAGSGSGSSDAGSSKKPDAKGD